MANILIVDDDPQIHVIFEKILTQDAHTVFKALNGEDGLGLVESSPVDLVMMDVNLPAENGFTCAEKILQFDPKARIAILSGYTGNEPELTDIEVNSTIKGYLTKPVDIAELSSLLARLVG